MTPKIGQLQGSTVLVSIPALFSDGAGRPYTLLGLELHGLWLQSDELNDRLLTEDTRDYARAAPVVFVPFAQIAGVLVPTAPVGALPPGAPPPMRRRRPRQPPENQGADQPPES
jgi:hypothetical protein